MPTVSPPFSAPEAPLDPREFEAWFMAQQERLAAETRLALSSIVDAAYTRFASTIVASGDFTAFDAIPVEWTNVVDKALVDGYMGMYMSGSVSAFVSSPLVAGVEPAASRGWVKIVNEDAANYSQSMRNRLVNVGNNAYAAVRDTTEQGIRQGWSGEQVSKELQQALNFSEQRAETVARTETMTAYNAGNHNGQKALGEYGPVAKEWLATGDARTRQSHLDAMAEGAIPVDQPFNVGGSEMQYPGDDGPPEEVVNCRCTVLYYHRGDETLDGSTIGDEAELDEAAANAQETRPTLPPEPAIGVQRRTSAEVEAERTERVTAAAEKFNVPPDSVREYLPQAEQMTQSVFAEARATQLDAIGNLESLDGGRIAAPNRYSGGEWNWLEQIHPDERARLNASWTNRKYTLGIDEIAEMARNRIGGMDSFSDEEVLQRTWLRWNRQVDASGAVARGRVPVDTRYSGRIDLDDILPNKAAQGYDTDLLVKLRNEELAAYLAQHDANMYAIEASNVLADAAAPTIGEPAFRMGYQAWESEVENIRYVIRSGEAAAEDWARYAELLPEQVEDIATSLEDAYSMTISLSRQAGLDVADWAVIPWEV